MDAAADKREGHATNFIRNRIDDDLEATLEFPDVDLSDWLTGRRPVPEDCRSPMLDRMVVECAGSGAGLPPELRRG